MFDCIAHNLLVHQGKAIPNQAREDFVDRWFNATTQRQIGRDLSIQKALFKISTTISINMDTVTTKLGETRHSWQEPKMLNETYTEFCKQPPSISAKEIHRKLINNNMCLRENCPSTSSLTRALGYSYKRLNVTARVN